MKSPSRWREPITLATIIIAIAAVLNLAATIYIGSATRQYVQATDSYVRVSKDQFSTSQRPYLGVVFVGLYPTCDGRPSVKTELESNRRSNTLPLIISVQNFGGVPARDVSISFVLKINGQAQPTRTNTADAIALFPGQQFSRSSATFSSLVSAVLDGSATEDVEIEVKYRGYLDEQYMTKEHAKYDSTTVTFDRMGAEYR
ncbi:MAG TPA: hypothetical protein VN696_17575 [Pyrinomonadaceae bacterium]|nr:hypothetical protein [Pyrinomonadaceae bacterium]